MNETESRYQVVCMDCEQVFEPAIKSALWWKAQKAADNGRLDAIHIRGEECGCVRKQRQPDAPFRVFGYYGPGEGFDIPCNTFVSAVERYRRAEQQRAVVFITGVSEAVTDKLQYS